MVPATALRVNIGNHVCVGPYVRQSISDHKVPLTPLHSPLSNVVLRARLPEYEDEADKQDQQTHHFRHFQNGTL